MLAFAFATIDDGNLVFLGPTPDTPAETPGHPHQVSVVQVVIRAEQAAPPGAKPACPHAPRKMGVQYDAINAIITGFQEIRIIRAERIRRNHARLQEIAPRASIRNTKKTAPAGATFSGRGPGKSVVSS